MKKLIQSIKNNWVYITITLFFSIIIYLTIYKLLKSYDMDNYRYTFSSIIQSIATIFALLVSSTIIIFQFSNNISPSIMKFFPKKYFYSMLLIIIGILILDSIALLYLPSKDEISTSIINILHFIIGLNALTLISIYFYALKVVNWFNPQSITEYLLKAALKTDNNTNRNNLILSLEEITIGIIEKRNIHYINQIMEDYKKLIEIYLDNNPKLNEKQITYNHPFAVISQSITRLSLSLIDNNLSALLAMPSRVLRDLVKAIDELNHNTDYIEIFYIENSIEEILEYCSKKSVESSATRFVFELPDDSGFSANMLGCIYTIIEQCAKTNLKETFFLALKVLYSINLDYIEDGLEVHKAIEKYFLRIISLLDNNNELYNLESPSSWVTNYTVRDVIDDYKVILAEGKNVHIQDSSQRRILNPVYNNRLKTFS